MNKALSKWRSDLSKALIQWELKNDIIGMEFGDALGFYPKRKAAWGRVQSGDSYVKDPPDLYALIYSITGLAEADPRKIPNFVGKNPKGTSFIRKVAWSDDEYHRWLSRNQQRINEIKERLLRGDYRSPHRGKSKYANLLGQSEDSISEEIGSVSQIYRSPFTEVNDRVVLAKTTKGTPKKEPTDDTVGILAVTIDSLIDPKLQQLAQLIFGRDESIGVLVSRAFMLRFDQMIDQALERVIPEILQAIDEQMQNLERVNASKRLAEKVDLTEMISPNIIINDFAGFLKSYIEGTEDDREWLFQEYGRRLALLTPALRALIKPKKEREETISLTKDTVGGFQFHD